MFTFSAFTVPAGSTITNVQVLYYDQKTASQGASWGARLRVGGSDRAVIDAHNPAKGTWTLRTATAATNPGTSAAWTVAEVNGTAGSNNLEQFGLVATDANPTCEVASIQLVVNYTEPVGHELPGGAEAGSYAITGTTAVLEAEIEIAVGEYALTGTAATLGRGYTLGVAAGSYVIWPEAAALRGNHLFADPGSYSIVGATSLLAFAVNVVAGSYAISGTDATLSHAVAGQTLAVDSGEYVLTGTDAALKATRIFTVDAGSYTHTGTAVTFRVTWIMPVDAGSYSISGQDATLIDSGGAVVQHLLACLGAGS
jgi:hypothetical protein